MGKRSEALAVRLEAGAAALASFAATLSETEWQTRLPGDGRKVGVVVHHVASVYPIEIQLAQALAAGNAITAVTWERGEAAMNHDHAEKQDGVTREAALALLATNSAVAAAALRALGDEELDRAAPGFAQQRRSAHVPVHGGGSCGAPQLSPPGKDQGRAGAQFSVFSCHLEQVWPTLHLAPVLCLNASPLRVVPRERFPVGKYASPAQVGSSLLCPGDVVWSVVECAEHRAETADC